MGARLRVLAAVGGVALLAFAPAACVSLGATGEVDDAARGALAVEAPEITPSAPPDVDIWTAAGEGDLDALMARKRAGANLDEQQPETGVTPLVAAVAAGDAATVRSQLEGGADPNRTGPDGSTMLLVAASAGHAEVVAALILAGADIDEAHWRNGATALHAAAFFGRLEVASVLVENGADVYATTNDGATVSQALDVDWATTAYLADAMDIPVDEESVMRGRAAVRALLAEIEAE